MLTAAQVETLTAAVANARRGADEAERLADEAGGWFASLIGADSTAAAARTHAKAARSLADTLAAKLDRWRSSATYPTDAEVLSFLEAAGVAAQNREAAEAVRRLSPVEAVREVATDTARDLVSPSKWSAVVWLVVLALVLVVVAPFLPILARRRV